MCHSGGYFKAQAGYDLGRDIRLSTKEWLLRAWKIDNEITALEREKETEEARATSVTAGYSDVKVQTSKKNSTEDATVAYIDYEKKIKKRIDELYAVKCEIFDAISKVDNPTYRTLLTLRYLQFMTWERIAEKMNIDGRHVYKLHNKALYVIRFKIQCH